MKIRINKIKTEYWLYIIIGMMYLFSFISIPFLEEKFFYYSYMQNIFKFLFFLSLILYGNINKISIIPLMQVCLFCFVFLLLTIYNHNDLYGCVTMCVTIICIFLYPTLLQDHDIRYFILGMIIAYIIIIAINDIYIIVSGQNALFLMKKENYIMGNVNTLIKIIFPGIVLMVLYDFLYKGKVTTLTWIMLMSTGVFMMLVKSTTGFIGITIFLFLLILYASNAKIIRVITPYQIVYFSLLLFFIIIFLHVFQQWLFSLSNLLFGKGMTLNTRYRIWDLGMAAFWQKPWGYGNIFDFHELIRLGNYYPSSAHNIFIDLLIKTGIIGCSIFVIFLFTIAKIIGTKKDHLYYIICFAMISYGLMANFEPFFNMNAISGYLFLISIMMKFRQSEERCI